MSYQEAYQQAWMSAGPEGALAFLTEVFHDPDNQHVKGKPTDYLSDKDEDVLTIGQGFDQMMRLFSAKKPIAERVQFILDCLTESRTPADDQAHRSQPFNAFLLNVSTYDHGDARLCSTHFDEESGTWKRQYGMNHQLIETVDNYDPETDDEDDSYDFIYKLENSDHYHVKHEGEEISGEVLFRHIRMAQYGQLMASVVNALLNTESFADFPKALPFHFLVNDADSSYNDSGTLQVRYEFHPVLTEVFLKGHPLAARHLASAKPPPELTPEEDWLYLITYLAEPKSPERSRLSQLLQSNEALLDYTKTLADESLERQATANRYAANPEKAGEQEPKPPTGELTKKLKALFDGPGEMAEKLASPLIDEACAVLELPRQRFEKVAEMSEGNRQESLETLFVWIDDDEYQRARGDSETLIQARRLHETRAAPARYASLFWTLGSDHAALAVDYVRRMFALPVAILPHNNIEEAISAAREMLVNVYPSWRIVPEVFKDDLRPAFEEVRKRLMEYDHPVMQVLVMEQELKLEHGPEVVQVERWDIVYDQEKIPESYVDAVGACIEEMPKQFEGYGAKWEFVLNRVKGLGKRADKLGPRIVELMNAYCSDDQYDVGRIIEEFAGILYELGLEEPPELIRDYAESDQYHNIENYGAWASKVPVQRWETFVKRFVESPDDFADPVAWEQLLYDSKKGLEIFSKGIDEADNTDAMLDRLVAAASNAGDLLVRLVHGLVELYNKKRHKPSDAARTQKVVRLLEALPSLDENHSRILQRAQLLLLRFAIDCSDPSAEARLAELLQAYPEHPMLHFNRAELAYARGGPESAAQAALTAIKALSADDLVYRKAFFQFTDNLERSWDSATTLQGYAAYRWAVDYLRKDAYQNGEFSDGQQAMDHDPFYRALAKMVSEWTDADRGMRLAEFKAEMDFGDKLKSLSNEELVAYLSADRWSVTLQVVKRLLQEPEQFAEHLLRVYDWFHDDEEKRLTLVSLYWPVDALQRPLLCHAVFQADLPGFIQRYPGIPPVQLAKTVFNELSELNLPQVVVETARKLAGRTVISSFLSVERAIGRLGAYDDGIALLDHILEDTSPKKPEFVLLYSNRGVFEYRKGDKEKAAKTFDELFAMDWSRFDYEEDEDDAMNKILGGDLDAKIADEFWQYFAKARFNAACVYANLERQDEAVESLREATRIRPTQYTVEKFNADSDFEPLRELPAYQEFISSLGDKL